MGMTNFNNTELVELNEVELENTEGGLIFIFLAGVALGAGAMYVYDHYIR